MGLSAAVCVAVGVGAGRLGGQRLAHRAAPAGGGAGPGAGRGRLLRGRADPQVLCSGRRHEHDVGSLGPRGHGPGQGAAPHRGLRPHRRRRRHHRGPAALAALGRRWASSSGSAMAILNLRFLDAGVAKVQTKGETDRKVLRRAMGTKSVTRLAVITVIAIGLLFLNGPLGIGTVIGLVIFQMLFVLNVGRVLVSVGAAMSRASNEHDPGQRQHHHRRPPRRRARRRSDDRSRRRVDHADRRRHRARSGLPHGAQGHLGRTREAAALLGDHHRAGGRPGRLGHRAPGPALRRPGRGRLLLHPDLQLDRLRPERRSGLVLAPPTGDVNLPLAMALTVIVLVHYNSIKARGFKGYLKHYATPYVRACPDQHHRGDHQADHHDLPTLREHLLGRPDDHA